MSDVDSSKRSAGHGPKTHGDADPTRETISRGATPVISNRPPSESNPAVTNHLGDSGADGRTQSSELPRQQIGRYQILKLLGTGGYGAVYLAQDDVLQRKVSIKLPHRRRIRGAAQMQLYMKEAMMVAQLDHPKIVPVYDVGTLPDGTCYVVSKYIDCETLADKIKQPVTPVEAIEIAIDLATTLQHVHKAGIVHRDLKPSNVLVSRDGEYFINDFGLAMIEVNETDRGVLIGTPAYMSPEQASGEGHLVDGRSDIFSLGVMLYEMLVGRRPFRGGSTEQVLYQIRTIDHKPLRQLNRELPVALERVCQKALSKQKGSRYSSAIEFADDLRTVLEDWKDYESEAVALNDPTSPTSKSGTQSNSAGDISWQTTSGDESRVVVIPKGLRAYDQHDAAFFKAMLPGPYDLTGCPESIRFWKNRINPPRSLGLTERQRSDIQVREIEPFRIGVIYGTSGCGKSSFIRAGLIPTLDESVRVCIVDATSQGTLSRLSQALAKCVPTFDQIPGHAGHKLSGYAADKSEDFSADLDEGAALKRFTERADNQEAKFDNATIPIDRRFASIRRGENLPEGDKVLIVIDQFEQWLNSADAEERALFIRTLRQCDGHRLQAILLVRDDFWLATSRLMRELDIELSASHNLAMIDLIDKSHARKLLGMLGRAYGRIGEDGSRLRREQRQFIHDAVDGLASDDRVIAVQLAMFAEMMKSRPWTRASLKSLGGIDRVVERFLHESFDAPSAPKNQRVHREAAYKLLGAMLPEIGLIRAGAIELSVLARTAGYDDDPEAMSDLIRVLDNRLKLITQVETGPGDASGDLPASKAARMETRYQLTHDSLIPAIRRWLAQYQNGSITGRAKRDLRARSQVWAAGRDDRQLASLLQWVRFSLLVPRADCTEVEQEMMSVAGWKHCRSIFFAMTLLAVGTLVVRHLRSESRVNNLVNQLTIATTNELPRILDEIDSEIGIVMPKLRDRVKLENEDDHVRYVAAMALPRDEELSPDVVTEYLLSAGLDLVALSRRLRPDWIDRFAENWANALSDTSSPVAERLRAGLFLAGRNATVKVTAEAQLDSRVEDHVAFLASAIVDESLSNKFSYADLVELAKPMRKALQPELNAIACDAEQGARQGAAISLIRDLHEGYPIDLVDAALDLPRKDFLEIVTATGLSQIPESEFDHYLSSADIDPLQSGRRAGRAVAIGAVKAMSSQSKSTNGEFDWATKMSEVTRVDREDVGAANLVHCLVPLGFDPERLFDSVFDGHAGIRCVQLYALGEFLQSQPTGNEGFRNRCRSIARERFQSDPDPGVFSAARWLLIRLGDQSWMDEELARRVQRVGEVEDDTGASSRLRINSQKTPMIRFPAGTIAATTDPDVSLPDPNWKEPVPYEIEVATDEVSVKLFKEYDPAYSHAAELRSQDELAPVGVVPWEDAVAYCTWLTLQDGMSESDFAYEADAEGNHTLRADFANRCGYRLPTAREWVAIWDADTTRVACINDDSLVEYYARILPYSSDTPEPIGGVKADQNGLFHLAGNAHEWCSDHLQGTSLRAARGSFYGWGLKERNQIVKESWISKYNNWIRYGFRVVRSTARVSTADTHQ